MKALFEHKSIAAIVRPSSVLAIVLASLTLVGCGSDTGSLPDPPPSGNSPPVASFTTTPESGFAPLEVQFSGEPSFDSDGVITSYEWTFNNGDTRSGERVSYTFTEAGDHTVTLKVTDDEGAEGQTSRTIAVDASRDGEARIECVYYNPSGDDDGREYVTVEALGNVNFSGWILRDAANHSFTLPDVQASAGETVTVPNYGGAKWNNDGDTAYLYNANGVLADTFSYSGGGTSACNH